MDLFLTSAPSGSGVVVAAAGTAMEYMQTVLDTAAVALAVAVTAVASVSSGRKEKGTMLIKDEEMEESISCSGIFN